MAHKISPKMIQRRRWGVRNDVTQVDCCACRDIQRPSASWWLADAGRTLLPRRRVSLSWRHRRASPQISDLARLPFPLPTFGQSCITGEDQVITRDVYAGGGFSGRTTSFGRCSAKTEKRFAPSHEEAVLVERGGGSHGSLEIGLMHDLVLVTTADDREHTLA